MKSKNESMEKLFEEYINLPILTEFVGACEKAENCSDCWCWAAA